MNKVVKFKDYNNTNEQTYKVNDDGVIEKQEWELYKDWHPNKFKVTSLTKNEDTTPFDNGDFVWIIKRNDNIVTILSASLDQELIDSFFNTLKDNTKKDETEDTNL